MNSNDSYSKWHLSWDWGEPKPDKDTNPFTRPWPTIGNYPNRIEVIERDAKNKSTDEC